MTNNKNIIDKYFINKESTFALIHVINDQGTFKFLLPLVFKDYDFRNIDQCISILSENFNGYLQMSRNINKIIKMCFKYLDKYIDTQGNLQNINESELSDCENDECDDIDEILRVFVKTLKKNTMEVCSNCGDYFLVYKKKIYNYDKDKMKLNLSNIENLKETKHLYGCRLFDFNNNNFYGDVDTKKFTSLIPCADSDDDMNNLNDTETENKISALKKLCGILKNMNESDSPKPTTRKNFKHDSSPFLKSSSQKKQSKRKPYKDDSSDSEDINVESLREKIKKLNSKKNKKSYDSDNCSPENEENEENEEKKEEPTQLQQLILYFLTNPDSLPKLIDTVNNTIDSFTDNLNPTKLLGRNRPLRIQKYFSNVNLVLKYIEMLKIIELKYKQTLEFRCNCDDFVLEDEAIYFNDHLNKIWDMVKLIICELSALRLNSITCTTPQCEDIKFNSSDLFVKDNKNYKKILERIGFATVADGSMDNNKVYLDQDASKNLLVNTISQHQRMMVNGFRKYMGNAYLELENSMAHINQAIITAIEACIAGGKTFAQMKTVEDGTDVSADALLTALKTAVNAVTSFNLTKFLDSLKVVVNRAYSFTTDQLKASSTAGVNTADHYALGVNYGTNFDYVTEIATTIKTDKLLGALYVVKKSSNTLKDEIENLVEKLLKSGKTSNDFTFSAVNLSEIRALSSKCELSEEYLSASTNLLQYVTGGVLTTVTFDANADGNISRAEFKNALDNVYDSTGAKTKYYEILYLSFSSLATFKSELTDKSDKDVIILRRKKLINFLKQLENDTNLSLSFFGEMATSYNTTTDSKAINAPPDVFVNIFKNHQHQHQQQQYHHSQPNPFTSFAGDNHHRAAPQQQEPQHQPYQEPASARTAGSNDILNDSDDNYDDTTDDESDTGFKLRESPKPTASSFRKTYTGSKKDYN